jgi:hypothetical protein
MARRDKHSDLDVRVSFEAARIAPQCLAEVYERLVPIPRRPTRLGAHGEPLPGASAAADRPGWRRVERG